jgi:hypothetical protein
MRNPESLSQTFPHLGSHAKNYRTLVSADLREWSERENKRALLSVIGLLCHGCEEHSCLSLQL